MKHLIPLAILFFLCLTPLLSFSQKHFTAKEDSFPPSEARLFSLRIPERQLLKLDLLPVMRLSSNGYIHGVVRAGYERKIFTSWSMIAEVATPWQVFMGKGNPRNKYYSDDLSVGFATGPRYYYNLRERMQDGRNADNLSANYLGMLFSTRLKPYQNGYTTTDRSGLLYSDNFAITPLWGFQRRLMRIGFLDFSFGAKFSYGDPVRAKVFHPKGAEAGWQFLPVTSLRIGLAL
ncbi:MAG: hypothetical protein R3C61_19090 [Bacteroidia bacterium]